MQDAKSNCTPRSHMDMADPVAWPSPALVVGPESLKRAVSSCEGDAPHS